VATSAAHSASTGTKHNVNTSFELLHNGCAASVPTVQQHPWPPVPEEVPSQAQGQFPNSPTQAMMGPHIA
jgi:hypothetical protein